MAFCRSCGAALKPRARFCHACGTPNEEVAPDSSHKPPVSSVALSGQIMRATGFLTVTALVLGLGGLAAWRSGVFNNSDSGAGELLEPREVNLVSTWKSSYADEFLSGPQEFSLAGAANVRDFPHSVDTRILRTLPQGSKLTGRMVVGGQPDQKWLKLEEGGYIWEGNLESLREIVSVSADSEMAGQAFPDFLHGRWSSMDTCRGRDMNYEVTITPTSIKFYESSGQLIAIAEDHRGKPIYQLRMSGEGEVWTESYTINIDSNGISLFIDSVKKNVPVNLLLHKPQTRCSEVFFID